MSGNPLEEEIKEVCKGVYPSLLQRYPMLRDAYHDGYDSPDLDPLRHEICLALMFGLNQAAITLTNHMLESLLKTSLIYHHSLENQSGSDGFGSSKTSDLADFLAEGRKRYGQNSLENNINAACTTGLITKDQKKLLKELRHRFRDPYSHADKEKTFGDTTVEVQPMRFENDGVVVGDPESPRAAEFNIVHGILQAIHAEQFAMDYFMEIDKLTRELLDRVFPEARSED